MAGRIILGFANPALDSNGDPDSASTLTFYNNHTTVLQAIYSDDTLLTPLTNPLPCDAAGRFPAAVWGPIGAVYSVKWSLAGATPITVDDIAPTIDGTGSIELATGATMRVGGHDGTAQITAQSAITPSISLLKTGVVEYSLVVDGNNVLEIGNSGFALFIDSAGRISAGANPATFAAGMQIGVAKALAPTMSLLKLGIVEYALTVDANDALNIGSSLTNGVALKPAVSFGPTADNAMTLGTAALRWSTVYAATGSINTSDETQKQWRGALTEAEMAAGKAIFAEIGGFKFLDAIKAKDGAARTHIGVRAQKVEAALKAHGLDPAKYAFLCIDQTEAGPRYGIRPDELAYFMLAVVDQRLSALEAK